ncbi:MAG: bifunctional oligoribonuclease/PAP phosphatase NrnA [Candidatus Marinimicrobia bacterium]|nr:bifunctional oligoribonuclease/PAP phosphatase NrnA [Candidatus Neomarinimicrobiota bacterium]MBT3495688.1 bifunctional oligoribonuclease/PAP phosphatase NrnA [Candidatus Neomarinimicrobiota bacterium]MBT3693117.1 bifunctional oligoribonuclease/PAP phosphatase NrnA [Candidatus Neomarinimicrobiota bacterium]MBT3731554.1 bifunctional oligoribonuclease/PAP phosphatase NrnA [Candidatus Neomarinimicrobiota bacterium]MBT4144006.1 bifunctional oligoribonuclease/PAP phosphatase NrnA [Candidatus Neom
MNQSKANIDWRVAGEIISSANRILLSTHENPDGDGLGSELAMASYFKNSGQDFKIINTSKLPVEYDYLNTSGVFETYDTHKHSDWIKSVDLALIFDVGDFSRCRSVAEEITKNQIKIMNIDHHPHPEKNGFHYHYVDLSAAATGCMVFDFLLANMKTSFNREMLTGIYTAVMTDTGCFRHSNTDEKCHQIAIESIKVGVNTSEIYQRIYENSSKQRMALLGQILSDVHYELDGTFAWFILTQKMLENAKAEKSDVDGFTDFIRTIKGVQVAMMIFEQDTKSCRINLRGKGKFSVNGIAKSMGGGGHRLAAGAVVYDRLDRVVEKGIKIAMQSIEEEASSNA